MNYEQLEKIELYNNIAQFNRELIRVIRIVNQYNGRYDYYKELNDVLEVFKSKVPLDIDHLELKTSYTEVLCLTAFMVDNAVDFELTRELGFNIYEIEYSMEIFEPEDITYGIMVEAFLAAKSNNVNDHMIKLSGIDDSELNVLNYDEIVDIVERLAQLNLRRFDHRIEDDVLLINYKFDMPKTVYI